MPDKHFDLVISINTLHNLYNYDLWSAFARSSGWASGAKYICVEAYRNEREKVNLMYWQLTCRAFHTPAEWDFVFKQTGYTRRPRVHLFRVTPIFGRNAFGR